MTTKPLPEKRYYTIREVADHLGVSTSLVRFWETEFPQIAPYKSKKGERRFTQKHVEDIDLIYQLVKVRGFTLKGAKREIDRIRKRQKEKRQLLKDLQEIRSYFESLLSTT